MTTVVLLAVAETARCETARLEGQVRSKDPAEGPLKDVFVTVYVGSEVLSDDGSTDERGMYAVDNLPVGVVLEVRYSKVNYRLDPETRFTQLGPEGGRIDIDLWPKELLEAGQRQALIGALERRIEEYGTQLEHELTALERYGLTEASRVEIAAAFHEYPEDIIVPIPGETYAQALDPYQVEKPGIAVLEFSNQTPSSLWTEQREQWIRDAFSSSLMGTGKFWLADRQSLDTIVEERGLAASGRVEASAAQALGLLLGVRYLLIGEVTELDLTTEEKSGLGGVGFTAKKKKELSATMQVRVVDTETGDVIFLDQVQDRQPLAGFSTGGGPLPSRRDEAVDKLLTDLAERLTAILDAAEPFSEPDAEAAAAAATGGN